MPPNFEAQLSIGGCHISPLPPPRDRLNVPRDMRATDQIAYLWCKGAGSFHIHRKTMKELGALAVLGVREQPNLAQNLVTHRH